MEKNNECSNLSNRDRGLCLFHSFIILAIEMLASNYWHCQDQDLTKYNAHTKHCTDRFLMGTLVLKLAKELNKINSKE